MMRISKLLFVQATTLMIVSLLFCETFTPSPVYAQAKESVMKKLKEGVAVRRQRQMRAKRVELSLLLGSSLGDTFNRNFLLGVQGQYYLSDVFGFGVHAFYGLNFETALSENIRVKRPNLVTPDSFSGVGLGVAAEAIFIPAFGKFSLLGQFTSRYDLHFTGGVGMIQVSGDAFESFSLAPTLGIGSRFFISDELSVNLQFKDYFYQRAENVVPRLGQQTQVKDESWQNQFFFNISVSFFLGKSTVSD